MWRRSSEGSWGREGGEAEKLLEGSSAAAIVGDAVEVLAVDSKNHDGRGDGCGGVELGMCSCDGCMRASHGSEECRRRRP